MFQVMHTVERTARMVEGISGLEAVVRFVDYVNTFFLGVVFNIISTQKFNPSLPLTSTNPSSKKSKKHKPQESPTDTSKPSQHLSSKAQILTKLKEKVGFTRRVLRWGVILKQLLLLRSLITPQLSPSSDTTQSLSLIHTGSFVVFLILDQMVLFHGILENQGLKNKYYGWSLKYGRLPHHLLGAVKYFLIAWEGYSNSTQMELLIVLLFVQSVLDFLMYLVAYLRESWYRLIGVLGIAGSIISLYKCY